MRRSVRPFPQCRPDNSSRPPRPTRATIPRNSPRTSSSARRRRWPASSSRTRRQRGAGSAPTARRATTSSPDRPASRPTTPSRPSGQSTYTWTTTSTDPRALQVPGSSNRVAAVWYSATSFTVDVNLADGQTHDLELYFHDWDNKGRGEQVQISDAATGTVLDTETISSFTNGVYLDWKVSGNLLITITRQAGANAVLNGLFLDPTSSPPPGDREFPPAGRDDAGELDRHLRAQGYDIVSRPVQPPGRRHGHPQRPVDLHLDHDLDRPPRLAGPRLVQPRRRRLVLRHQLHRRRQPRPTARRTTWSCTSSTGTTRAGASRCRSATPARARCWTPRRSRRSAAACTWTGRSRATS